MRALGPSSTFSGGPWKLLIIVTSVRVWTGACSHWSKALSLQSFPAFIRFMHGVCQCRHSDAVMKHLLSTSDFLVRPFNHSFLHQSFRTKNVSRRPYFPNPKVNLRVNFFFPNKDDKHSTADRYLLFYTLPFPSFPFYPFFPRAPPACIHGRVVSWSSPAIPSTTRTVLSLSSLLKCTRKLY